MPQLLRTPRAHVLSLAAALALLWWLLSGRTETFVLSLGAGSVLLVLWLAHRMDVVDREGHPIHLTHRALGYFLWLGLQIYKANVDVAKRVLRPGRCISPTLVRVPATQKTDLGRVIFANSITLTPGTVSIHVDRDYIDVHSLSREGAEDLMGGEMDRRCSRVEGA